MPSYFKQSFNRIEQLKLYNCIISRSELKLYNCIISKIELFSEHLELVN